jgi:hypothetical protein
MQTLFYVCFYQMEHFAYTYEKKTESVLYGTVRITEGKPTNS